PRSRQQRHSSINFCSSQRRLTMKSTTLLILAVAVIATSVNLNPGKVFAQARINATQQRESRGNQDDDDLIRAMFDPITDDLQLTPNQKFRIVAMPLLRGRVRNLSSIRLTNWMMSFQSLLLQGR